jgi:anti-sigma regulatory factor (Ser/Thr protein kinase)
LELILTNTLEEKQRIFPALEAFAREHQLPSIALQAADLALEEHLTNLLAYAYNDTAPHDIVVRLTLKDRWLQVEVEDDGRPYNPLSRPPVDTSLPLAEKPIGGLGIHLIRKMMDEADYRRDAGKNVLRLRKKID